MMVESVRIGRRIGRGDGGGREQRWRCSVAGVQLLPDTSFYVLCLILKHVLAELPPPSYDITKPCKV
jgi:hypothetical protein